MKKKELKNGHVTQSTKLTSQKRKDLQENLATESDQLQDRIAWRDSTVEFLADLKRSMYPKDYQRFLKEHGIAP